MGEIEELQQRVKDLERQLQEAEQHLRAASKASLSSGVRLAGTGSVAKAPKPPSGKQLQEDLG